MIVRRHCVDDADVDPSKPLRIKLITSIYSAIMRRAGILGVHLNNFKLSGGLECLLYRLARSRSVETVSKWV